MRKWLRRNKGLILDLPSILRRLKLIWSSKLMARLAGIELDMDIHPRVQIESGVRIKFSRSRRVTIRICENVRLEEGVEIRFFGNIGYDPELYIGPMTVVHRHASFTIGGRLHFEGMNEIGIGTVIRANQSIEFGTVSGSGEYASFFDFFHAFDEDRGIYQETVLSQPIKIGRYVMVSAKACVTPGTTLSEVTVVMPNSVVSGYHPSCDLLGGIPAKTVDKAHVVPILGNPFMQFMLTWNVDEPGPNFKSIDEARAGVADPEVWSKDLPRYQEWVHKAREAAGLPPEEPSGNGSAPVVEAGDATPA